MKDDKIVTNQDGGLKVSLFDLRPGEWHVRCQNLIGSYASTPSTFNPIGSCNRNPNTQSHTEIHTLKPLTSITSNIHVTFYAPGWHMKMGYTNGRLDSLLYHYYQNTNEWIVFARLSSVDEIKLPFAPLCISAADSTQLTNWLRNYIIVPTIIVRFLWRIVLFNHWYN